ncbi:hypothetical protein HHK36_008809 [Tetracentron sinense]|uniref:Uncharacterized protein n=1 Tax=Tetracentron sinense TaxID=13715 RepID=A0A834ZQS3_TETSI|nr:hypothetical protein HHK36_008809 [Tetracentron sinense]
MEESNICRINHLDVDVRLPPRKRLLAELKKWNPDCTSPLSLLSPTSIDFSTSLRDILSFDSNRPHLSPEEIVDASRSAAVAASEVAAAARAAAEEKAAVAAMAASAAKSALELVVSVSEKTICKERCLRKNKPKKHVPVKFLYKNQLFGNCETDEQLACRLHRAMNSSPRISKNSDRNTHKNKKHKSSPALVKTRVSNRDVVWEGIPPSTRDRNAEAGEVESGGSIQEVEYIGEVDEKASECNQTDCAEMDKFLAGGKTEASLSKEKYWRALEDIGITSRKRGKIKQKKLSLRLCTIRDRSYPKEEPDFRGIPLSEESKGKCTARNMPLISVGPAIDSEVSVEATSIWKCDIKAPQCFAESEIMQSSCSNHPVMTEAAMIEVDP